MKRKGLKKIEGIEGYLTVEASLLLPFVIGVIVYVIYFQFFWYNRCLMDQETAMTAVRAAQAGSVATETLQKEIWQWRDAFLTDRYVGWEADEPILTAELGKISVSGRGRLKLPNAAWNAEITYEVGRIDTAFYLRQLRRIMLQTEEKG